MNDDELKPDTVPQRLCSEIQLFDLCSLTSCSFKSGRFCNNPELLSKFERIADQELRSPERYVDEEADADQEADDDFYDYDDESDGNDDWEDDN